MSNQDTAYTLTTQLKESSASHSRKLVYSLPALHRVVTLPGLLSKLKSSAPDQHDRANWLTGRRYLSRRTAAAIADQPVVPGRTSAEKLSPVPPIGRPQRQVQRRKKMTKTNRANLPVSNEPLTSAPMVERGRAKQTPALSETRRALESFSMVTLADSVESWLHNTGSEHELAKRTVTNRVGPAGAASSTRKPRATRRRPLNRPDWNDSTCITPKVIIVAVPASH